MKHLGLARVGSLTALVDQKAWAREKDISVFGFIMKATVAFSVYQMMQCGLRLMN